MGCPLATDRLGLHTSTITIPHTTFHIRLGSELGPRAPFSRQIGSMVQTSDDSFNTKLSLKDAHHRQGVIVNHLIHVVRRPRILSG